MQKFAELYSEISNLPQVGEDFGNGEVETIFAIPWGHHKLIIDKCNGNRRKALFFVYQVLQNGWSRAVLLNFLDTDLFEIIFVCKYRKKLLVSRQISDDIKQFSYEICQRHKVIIKYMETDKDHIHYMIETEPTMSVSRIVNLMKSYTTHHIWERYPNYLRKHFWKEHTFWTDGYFVCSVGNVSEKMLKRYIENQG